MAVYGVKDLGKLAARISGKSKIADKAAADTINKSATFAISESVNAILNSANLQKNYIKRNIKTVSRAKVSNLQAIVSTNERGTLLYRYPFAATKDGYRVSVNKTGGFREIKGASMMSLRGSGIRTIGVRNKDAVEIFTKALNRGKSTSAKAKKLENIKKRAASKPYGMTPLYSKSIYDMFTSVREDIQPQLGRFMRVTFIQDFRRYDNKN